MGLCEEVTRVHIRGWGIRGLLLLILFFFGIWVVVQGSLRYRESLLPSVPYWLLIPTGFIICGIGLVGVMYCAVQSERLRRLVDTPPLAAWNYTEQEWWWQRRENPETETRATSEALEGMLVLLVPADILLMAGLLLNWGASQADIITILAVVNGGMVGLMIFSPFYRMERQTVAEVLQPGAVIAPEGVIIGSTEYPWDLSRLRPGHGAGKGVFRTFLETRLFPPLFLEEVSLVTNGQAILEFYFTSRELRDLSDPEGLLFGIDYISVVVPEDRQEAAEQVRAFFGGTVVRKGGKKGVSPAM